MKVVHMAPPANQKSVPLTYSEHIALATELENSKEFEEAIHVYQQCVALAPTDEYAYERLMFLYHEQMNYSKELDIVNSCIQAFGKVGQYKSKSYHQPIGKPFQAFGNFILKSTGFAKWIPPLQVQTEPLSRWNKWTALLKTQIKD